MAFASVPVLFSTSLLPLQSDDAGPIRPSTKSLTLCTDTTPDHSAQHARTRMGALDRFRGPALYNIMKTAAGLSFMNYGYDAGYLGGILAHEPFLDTLGHPENDAWTIPFIASSYTLAALITSGLLMFISWRLGRKGTILLGCLCSILGTVIQTATFGVPQLIVGRVVTGIGIGCISSSVPTYLAETGAENADRGKSAALNGILLISGVPLALWISYGCTKSMAPWSWRLPIALQAVFAIASGGLMLFLPDTPRYYYVKGNEAKGDEVLCRLNDKPLDHPYVQLTKREIFAAIQSEEMANEKLHWSQFATFGIIDKTELRIIRRLVFCFLITFLREWCGINLIIYYSTLLFINIGIEGNLVTLLAAILATVFALGTVPLYWTIERIGRRKIMGWGAVGLSLTMLAFIVCIGIPNQTDASRWCAVGFIFAFVIIFGYAWQGIIWLVAVEIAPLEYRHIGASMAAMGEWTSSFWTVFAGQIAVNIIGYKMYIVILVGDVLSIAFIWFCIPETLNKSLEEVDFLFSRNPVDLRRDIEAKQLAEHGSLADKPAQAKLS